MAVSPVTPSGPLPPAGNPPSADSPEGEEIQKKISAEMQKPGGGDPKVIKQLQDAYYKDAAEHLPDPSWRVFLPEQYR